MKELLKWQVQEAKSKFSELLETAIKKGPQIITKRGEDIAVIISIQEYAQLKSSIPGIVTKIQNAPRIDLDLRG